MARPGRTIPIGKSAKRKRKAPRYLREAHAWHREKKQTLKRLIRAQGNACGICGEQMSLDDGPRLATVDHIIPRSEGGSDSPTNLRAACRKCNNERK